MFPTLKNQKTKRYQSNFCLAMMEYTMIVNNQEINSSKFSLKQFITYNLDPTQLLNPDQNLSYIIRVLYLRN